MWNVAPELMCSKHLVAEHLETHMFLGAMQKGTSMQGYLDNGILEIHTLEQRHDVLVAEMLKRGFNHRSPFIVKTPGLLDRVAGKVDPIASYIELLDRCMGCRALAPSPKGRVEVETPPYEELRQRG